MSLLRQVYLKDPTDTNLPDAEEYIGKIDGIEYTKNTDEYIALNVFGENYTPDNLEFVRECRQLNKNVKPLAGHSLFLKEYYVLFILPLMTSQERDFALKHGLPSLMRYISKSKSPKLSDEIAFISEHIKLAGLEKEEKFPRLTFGPNPLSYSKFSTSETVFKESYAESLILSYGNIFDDIFISAMSDVDENRIIQIRENVISKKYDVKSDSYQAIQALINAVTWVQITNLSPEEISINTGLSLEDVKYAFKYYGASELYLSFKIIHISRSLSSFNPYTLDQLNIEAVAIENRFRLKLVKEAVDSMYAEVNIYNKKMFTRLSMPKLLIFKFSKFFNPAGDLDYMLVKNFISSISTDVKKAGFTLSNFIGLTKKDKASEDKEAAVVFQRYDDIEFSQYFMNLLFKSIEGKRVHSSWTADQQALFLREINSNIELLISLKIKYLTLKEELAFEAKNRPSIDLSNVVVIKPQSTLTRQSSSSSISSDTSSISN